MIFHICSLCAIVLLLETINALSYAPFRRQIYSPNSNLPRNEQRFIHPKIPSGSILGATYYGVGQDPNYGSYIAKPNRPGGGGILPIRYSSDSNPYGSVMSINQAYQQRPQQQNYWLNSNGNNGWQRPNTNNYNQYYAGYGPGNQGGYPGDGNYWFNKGQFIIPHPWLLLIALSILVLSK